MAFDGKVCIVTGAGSGIGRASALRFASSGASVIVADIDPARGEATLDDILQVGGIGEFVQVDIADESSVAAMVERAVSRFGAIDVAHNNAGIAGSRSPLVEYEQSDFDRVLAVHARGTWLCMKHEIAAMLRLGNGGAIVNMGSIAGILGIEHDVAYAAAKHAVVGLTRSAALEVASHGIRVNVLCPGAVETPMTSGSGSMASRIEAAHPIGRWGQPDEIAAAVEFLCSSGASFITGAILPIDGGFSTR